MIVRQSSDPAELTQAFALRERVFCSEQGVPLELERDGRDSSALHVVAVDGDAVLGTCRLLFDGDDAKLGRMAVEPDARGRGVGSAMLAEAESLARDRGARRVVLHAQVSAETLYARAGFRPYGVKFMEAGIEHVAMVAELA